jgi:TolA-binding protein
MVSWISNMARLNARQAVGFVALIAFVGFVGCGGSSETTQATGQTDSTAVHPDSIMIASDTTQRAAIVAPETTAVTQAPPPTKEEMLQQQIEEIKTENIQLKQKFDAADQKNKELMAKVSDLEAAQITAQEKGLKPGGALASASKSTKPPSMKKAPAGKSASEEVQHYEGAVGLAKEKKYKEAIEEFKALLDSGIKSDYADNCHYWIGLCYYGLHNYKTAVEHFQEVDKFKVSEKKDDSQFMLAQSYERMGNRQQAQAEFKKFVELYPNSEYLKRAQAKLK